MEKQFYFLRNTRENTLKALEGLTLEQINIVPPKFNNNIAWNLAHLVVTQQLLCYRLSGVDGYVGEDDIKKFRKGTAPNINEPMSEKEFSHYKEQFVLNIDRIEEDYKNKKFISYQPYTTSFGTSLNSFEDAVTYNNIHEGLHLGSILALKHAISL